MARLAPRDLCVSSLSWQMARLASGAFDDVRYQFSPHWVQDEEAFHCAACMTAFSLLTRRHHCRYCGRVFCDDCSSRTAFLPGNEHAKGDASVRLCDQCCDEVERAPHLDGRLSDCGAEQSSVLDVPANAVTRRLFSDSGATPESMLAADSDCFAAHCRLACGDYVLHNPQFGAVYAFEGVPSNSSVDVSLLSSSKQLSGFINIPLSSILSEPARVDNPASSPSAANSSATHTSHVVDSLYALESESKSFGLSYPPAATLRAHHHLRMRIRVVKPSSELSIQAPAFNFQRPAPWNVRLTALLYLLIGCSFAFTICASVLPAIDQLNSFFNINHYIRDAIGFVLELRPLLFVLGTPSVVLGSDISFASVVIWILCWISAALLLARSMRLTDARFSDSTLDKRVQLCLCRVEVTVFALPPLPAAAVEAPSTSSAELDVSVSGRSRASTGMLNSSPFASPAHVKQSPESAPNISVPGQQPSAFVTSVTDDSIQLRMHSNRIATASSDGEAADNVDMAQFHYDFGSRRARQIWALFSNRQVASLKHRPLPEVSQTPSFTSPARRRAGSRASEVAPSPSPAPAASASVHTGVDSISVDSRRSAPAQGRTYSLRW